VFLGLLFICHWYCCYTAYSQLISPQSYYSSRLSLELRTQPKTPFETSPFSFRQSGLLAGASFPLIAKLSDDSKFLGLSLTTGLQFSEIQTELVNGKRMLVSGNIGVNGVYQFTKHFFAFSLRSILNEDEYTIDTPSLWMPRLTGTLIYGYTFSNYLRIYTGVAYTQIFGNVDAYSNWVPLLGARIRMGKNDNLTVILPLTARYFHKFNNRFRLSAFISPLGGQNQLYNKLNIADSLEKTFMFRRRAFLVGVGFAYLQSRSLLFNIDLSAVGLQRLALTNTSKDITYFSEKLQPNLMLSIRCIWRPWLNTNRSKNRDNTPSDDTIETDDILLLGL
jgi:hypothetical protein